MKKRNRLEQLPAPPTPARPQPKPGQPNVTGLIDSIRGANPGKGHGYILTVDAQSDRALIYDYRYDENPHTPARVLVALDTGWQSFTSPRKYEHQHYKADAQEFRFALGRRAWFTRCEVCRMRMRHVIEYRREFVMGMDERLYERVWRYGMVGHYCDRCGFTHITGPDAHLFVYESGATFCD